MYLGSSQAKNYAQAFGFAALPVIAGPLAMADDAAAPLNLKVRAWCWLHPEIAAIAPNCAHLKLPSLSSSSPPSRWLVPVWPPSPWLVSELVSALCTLP